MTTPCELRSGLPGWAGGCFAFILLGANRAIPQPLQLPAPIYQKAWRRQRIARCVWFVLVAFLLSTFSVVGFAGARQPCSGAALAVRGALSRVSPTASIFTGCARGVDQLVRAAAPPERLVVFAVSGGGRSRGLFAERSVRFVAGVAGAGGALVVFPGVLCPPALRPSASASRCFAGHGSGSWASAAFALGSGVPVLLWLPFWLTVGPPKGWGFVALGGPWFLAVPSGQQLALPVA